ncbi:MAG: RluA family pseudouridine synthase [Clostridia bacterium]
MTIIKFNPDGNERIDNYLAKEMDCSRSQVYKLVDAGSVEYNGKVVTKCGQKLNGGEIVVNKEDKIAMTATPQDIPLDIIYEDDEMLIINKAQGMVVHPALGSPDNTLVNALMFHIKSLSDINGDFRPGIVHRLDKDTSGLLVVAKNNKAHKNLAEQIATKQAGRHYLALVVGNIKEEEGVINRPIARSTKDRKIMAVDDTGRSALTHYKVRERFGNYTLVEFKLATGRTHQIRVHAKYIKHAVVGDITYGNKDNFGLSGQLLHAYKLDLIHPKTGEAMSFEAPLPDYFKKVLVKLRKENQD